MTDRRSSLEGRDRKMLSALHATVSVLELPMNAPSTIRDLTIDVTDPLKIYTIYRASRRFGFQRLVERLVIQLRYGCEHHECSTHTCFTYRAQAAGSKPLRRYNAASARTLACYLASQDNPSTQLCQYICDGSPARHAKLSVKALQRPTTREPSRAKSKLPIHNGRPNIHKQNLHDRAQSASQPPITGNAQVIERACYPDNGSRIDHKSFVQNVFSTVSFRLLEWLTPTGVSALLSAELGGSSEKLSQQSRSSNLEERVDLRTSGLSDRSSSVSDDRSPVDMQVGQEGIKGMSIQSDHTSKWASSWQSSFTLDPSQEVASGNSDFAVQVNDFEIIQKPSQANFDHQNTSEMPGKSSDDPKKTALEISKPLVTSLGSRQAPVFSLDGRKQTIDLTSGRDKSKTTKSHDVLQPKLRDQANGTEPDTHLPKSSTGANKTSPQQTLQAHTQSLALLSYEIIEELEAVCLPKNLKSSGSPEPGMEADVRSVTPEMKQRSTLHRPCDWSSFLQQSIFYVLSDSTLLLRSFRDSHGSMINSRLTALSLIRLVAMDKPLVLDSLWVSAEHLYTPPKTDRFCVRRRSKKTSLSNSQAAELMVICLRSLIATVPQEKGDQVLQAAPLRPSYRSARPSFKASSNPLEECLQQNDAFSDELALRLARRIFSAIPVRLRFQNLALLDTEETETVKTHSFMDKLIDLFVSPGSGSPDDKSSMDLVQTDIGLLVDWARVIMYQDWNGSAEVPMDGAFGGALTLVAALYESQKCFIDVEWKMDIFAERLNELEVPYQWLGYTENKRTKHLLDYPFLFSTSILVTYFRSCNYYQMCKAFETAEAMKRHVHAVSAPTMLLTDTNRRIQLNQQLETALYQYLVLRIRRSNVLEDTFNQLWRRQVRELLRPLKIRLGEGDEGEEGMDSGGVQQEFFRLAIAEALNPDFGAFTADGSSHMSWFQPGSPEPLWKFELIGVIVSLAVYNGLTLPVTFPKVLYAKLLCVPLTFDTESITDGWRDLAKSLDALLKWDESEQGLISEILCRAYEFSAPLFEVPVSCEMKEGSDFPKYGQIFNSNHDVVNHKNPADTRLVDSENKHEFVRDYIQWLTDISIRPQFEAFRKGFVSCLDHRSLTLLNPASLQSLVEGEQEIDMNGLKKYARYEGYEPSDRTIKQFWSIVTKYSDSEKRSLLEFVTASDRIPVGGISNLTFLIVKNGTEEMDGHLPTAYTCYGTLLLPQYSSKEILKEKLALALENAKGFGFA